MIKEIELRFNFVKEKIYEYGNILKEGFYKSDKGTINKDGRELLTYYDKLLQDKIKNDIKKNFLDDLFLAEEDGLLIETLDKKDSFIWIIDPIDGTNNFAHSIPYFAISIALYFNKEILLGFVYNPIYEELFYSKKGDKSYLNDKIIKVSSIENIKNSILATGFPYKREDIYSSNILETYSLLMNITGLRRFGAASLDICFVAAGRLDGYWEFNLKPWDIAAGYIIAKNAGSQITDFKGKEFDLKKSDFIVSNGKIHQKFIEMLNNKEKLIEEIKNLITKEKI